MRSCETRLLVILFCCACIFGCDRVPPVVKPPIAVDLIPDPNLAAAVREALGLTTDVPLTTEALQNLRILEAQDHQIVALTGLEYAPNLTKLPLTNNQISDVSPLTNLTNLRELWLGGNQISDVSPLANLTNLTELYLSNNQLSDISPLANLTNLRNLYLSENQISDIVPLAANRGLGTGDILSLKGNPLDEAAIRTHIPTLQERGVRVLQ